LRFTVGARVPAADIETVPADRTSSHEAHGGFSPHSVRLAWILASAYLLVIAYASLQPFEGWRVPAGPVPGFLAAQWPHYITLQDVAVNVAAYAPLGLLLSVVFGAIVGPLRGAAAATLAAALLSLCMESAQTFLPSRIASNVDLLANAFGALIGAMAAPLLAPSRALGGKLHTLRHRWFQEGMAADTGLVVVSLWLITQLHATVQAFGTGHLRATFHWSRSVLHTPALAVGTEATVALFSLLGVGLLLTAFAKPGARRLPLIGGLIGAALLIRLFTAVAIVSAPAPFAWFTPGVMAGIAAGGVLAAVAIRLPRRGQLLVAAVCILIATAAINLAPENPYQSVPPRLLAGGASHFLNFSGIVRALSELWPLIAIGFLLYALLDRRR